MKSMRQEFADTMLEVGQKDSNLVVLIGDIGHFALQPFARKCPGRFYNIGICEQTMVNMAAGLSKVGFFPVVHTIAPFIVERSFEQIKDDFGYQKLGVNIVTVGSAFDYTGLGCTHHCYDDFALLKNIPRMQILYPASTLEFNRLFKQTYNNGLPTYFRLPGQQHEIAFKKSQIQLGKAMVVQKGSDVTIIAVGSQLKTVMDSVDSLKSLGISPEIIYVHTVKPLDEKTIVTSISKTKKCLVIEEHSMYGGVFDDVLRTTSGIGAKFAAINTGDKFVHTYGTYQDVCKKLGFTAAHIVKTIQKKLLKN